MKDFPVTIILKAKSCYSIGNQKKLLAKVAKEKGYKSDPFP